MTACTVRRIGPGWRGCFGLHCPRRPTHRPGSREIPSSIAPAMTAGERWTHVAVDEAQDLCVTETSLLGWLVHPDGGLTVSADSQQIVSPVRGMKTSDALSVANSLRGEAVEHIYPFARNMRQSKQIGRFLQGFYEAAF